MSQWVGKPCMVAASRERTPSRLRVWGTESSREAGWTMKVKTAYCPPGGNCGMVCAFRSTGVCGGLMFFYTQTNTKVDKNKNYLVDPSSAQLCSGAYPKDPGCPRLNFTLLTILWCWNEFVDESTKTERPVCARLKWRSRDWRCRLRHHGTLTNLRHIPGQYLWRDSGCSSSWSLAWWSGGQLPCHAT